MYLSCIRLHGPILDDSKLIDDGDGEVREVVKIVARIGIDSVLNSLHTLRNVIKEGHILMSRHSLKVEHEILNVLFDIPWAVAEVWMVS